jgi:hypothetical protein
MASSPGIVGVVWVPPLVVAPVGVGVVVGAGSVATGVLVTAGFVGADDDVEAAARGLSAVCSSAGGVAAATSSGGPPGPASGCCPAGGTGSVADAGDAACGGVVVGTVGEALLVSGPGAGTVPLSHALRNSRHNNVPDRILFMPFSVIYRPQVYRRLAVLRTPLALLRVVDLPVARVPKPKPAVIPVAALLPGLWVKHYWFQGRAPGRCPYRMR